MKNYIVSWDIRDGENEYHQKVVVKVRELRNPQAKVGLFRKVLKEFYGWKVRRYEGLGGVYALENDYRAIELSDIREISEIEAFNIAQVRAIYSLELH